MNQKLKAVNWNKFTDQYSKIFWDQNIRQFWVDEEINLNSDKLVWQSKLTKNEQDVYEKVLTGLTLLDTYQGCSGMTNLCINIDNLHAKAVIQFMGMMEQMHAKSYSSIFSTLSSTDRINELFSWVENNSLLQQKLNIIIHYYNNINSQEDLYMAMVASVFLESFLFYSGFFYPLFLSGMGILVNSAEIINLIIRDESVHGLYIGTLSYLLLNTFDEATKEKLKIQTHQLLEKLMQFEEAYTREIYQKLNLVDDVIVFIKYNANKALQNLNYDNYYDVNIDNVNPIVLNGLKTTTKNHDFFSTKGNGYIKTTNIKELSDDDFIFE